MDSLNSYKLTMEIVDVDSNTGVETRLGEFKNENYLLNFDSNVGADKAHRHFNLKECLANKKFEGRLLVDGTADATVQIVVDSLVRDFLQTHNTFSASTSTAKSPKVSLTSLNATPKSTYTGGTTSSVLGQSRSWIESYCEEDNAFDVSAMLLLAATTFTFMFMFMFMCCIVLLTLHT